MKRDHLERALDLRRADLDPELLAAPLTVRHASRLMMDGGNDSECPNDHSALHPRHMECFLDPAVKVAQAYRTRVAKLASDTIWFDVCASVAARNTYPILVNGDISIDKC